MEGTVFGAVLWAVLSTVLGTVLGTVLYTVSGTVFDIASGAPKFRVLSSKFSILSSEFDSVGVYATVNSRRAARKRNRICNYLVISRLLIIALSVGPPSGMTRKYRYIFFQT